MKNIYTWAAVPARRTLTVRDLKVAKGKKKFTQVTANTIEEANAAEKAGFDMEIQTNGSYLTSSFVEKHPGIKDLSILRFSLYGIDNESTIEVTKNKKAYDVVKENLIDYLKLKTKTS